MMQTITDDEAPCDKCDTTSWHNKGSILGTLQCPSIKNFERESDSYCTLSSVEI